MLQLRITKKVQTELGIKPSELAEIKKPDSFLGNWYINLFYLDRRKTLIYMNERTFLSFIIFGIRKKNIKQLPERLTRGLEQYLLIEGYGPEQIKRAFSGYDDYEYTRTDSKATLGNMNDLVNSYKYMTAYNGGLKYCDLTAIIINMNRMPQRRLDWATSLETFQALLETEKMSS